MRVKVILTALDATERAEGVLRVGVALAGQFGSQHFVVRTILVPPDFAPAAHVEKADPLPHFLEVEAEGELHRLMASVPGAGTARPLVRLGDPCRAIVSTALGVGADLIVIGNHGYRGIDWVIGTTTGKVSTRAPCHVFVVHDVVTLASSKAQGPRKSAR